MTTQHTPGRLDVVNDTGEWAAEYDAEGTTCSVGLVTESGSMVALAVAYSPNIFADPDPTANARRLVACWNRLEKFTTEQIEDFGYDLFADVRPDFDRAMRERDKLQLLCAEWEKKAATWLASPEAAQRLDGYRDLAQQLNTATAQRDELLAVLRGVQKRCAPSGFVGMDGQYLKEVGAAIAKAEGDAK